MTADRVEQGTAGLPAPLAAVDLRAWRRNAADLVRRAGGKPIRVASKSVRSRDLLRDALSRPGFAGILACTLPEALWLAGDGSHGTTGDLPVSEDVVVGYPTADVPALRRLAADGVLAARVTVMIDDVAQLDLLPTAPAVPVRVCLDVDASLRLGGGRIHLGVRRSPLHTPAQVRALAAQVAARPGVRLVGLMCYEAQVAGLQDDAGGNAPAAVLRRTGVRGVQALSLRELRRRRAAVVAAVREVADLQFVNGGGTGSVHSTAAEAAVTEVTAGSGLLAPTLFDGYRAFHPEPAAFFALPVVRRPGPGVVTVLGGGWIASGPAGADRAPVPVHPPGLRLLPAEGAGEVQTPLAGPAADALRIGDRVWFRHAKAGELADRVDAFHLVDDTPDGPAEAGTAVTYRGEGRTFL